MVGLLKRLTGREKRSASYAEYGPGAASGVFAGGGIPSAADASVLSVVETASSIIARSLAMAEVHTSSIEMQAALGPLQLSMIARDLLRCGNSVWAIDQHSSPGDPKLALVPAHSWNVTGDTTDPRRWMYDPLEIACPTGVKHRVVEGEDVLHFRLYPSPAAPWCGTSPLARAKLSARLATLIETSLSNEAAFLRRQIMLSTKTVDPATRKQLEEALNSGPSSYTDPMGLGQSWTVLSAGTTFQDGGPPAYTFTRLGMQPDMGSVELRSQVMIDLAAALGVPPELIRPGAGGGSSAREAFRRMLHQTVRPIAAVLEQEFADKDMPLELDLSGLGAADVAGRARAYKQLVESGLESGEAARIVGFEFGDRDMK